MKSQKGFTLIELLLVLAIIGIISAIAIPALLGQRSRARDKSAKANAASIISDLLASYDKIKDSGAAPANGAAIIGTAAAPLVPQCFTAVNPWSTAGALTGYNVTSWNTEVAATPGSATATAAAVDTLGQVQLGYLAPAGGANGVLASAVYLNNAFSVNGAPTNKFVSTAGVD
ncbi:MAG: type II secretion system protein [Holophagaceae bacterium]|uniref:Type II secretion system protein n=1 Tax=Candidatus Geothrix skivensis TaxID=2954439 RepID=A0A9D7XGY9_9BACT|nr:type II secretion system protein [Candidatus Geothrix skivensis]